ncbi:MAG TPA: VOC family protein [Candidatus Acidoferrum sp.]|nr:VOC family protein [Candidatus Acidoferrum sp.]
MTTQITYPPGVPCWVETLQADPHAAIAFYAGVFGWEVVGPGPMPEAGGEYFVARVGGRDVAGIATLPSGAAPTWMTYVRVDDADAAVERARRIGGAVIAEPFDALPAGRAAVLACPGGAVFGLWQPHAREGAQLINAPSAWSMSVLRTSDLDGATAFYETLFGWKPQTFDAGANEVTLCRLSGYVGGKEQQPVPRDVVACIVPSDDGSAAGWDVDFWVDDTDAAAARAERLGGRVVVPPYDIPKFRQAVLADREGATFSISQLILDDAERPQS